VLQRALDQKLLNTPRIIMMSASYTSSAILSALAIVAETRPTNNIIEESIL
jgi:hypothetical protein